MADDPNPEVELKALAVGFKKATDEVKAFAEKYQTEMKNLGQVTEETKAASDKALTEMNTLSERLTAVEQKMVRRQGNPDAELKSLGDLVLENDGIKALIEKKTGQARMSIELKDITSGNPTWGAGRSPSTSLVVADRQPMVTPPMRQMVVRSLLTPGTTSSNAIEYTVETDDPLVTGAAVVSESQLKPQSNITFDLKSGPVRTIAHFMKASRQILDDAPQLRSIIDGRLTYRPAIRRGGRAALWRRHRPTPVWDHPAGVSILGGFHAFPAIEHRYVAAGVVAGNSRSLSRVWLCLTPHRLGENRAYQRHPGPLHRR